MTSAFFVSHNLKCVCKLLFIEVIEGGFEFFDAHVSIANYLIYSYNICSFAVAFYGTSSNSRLVALVAQVRLVLYILFNFMYDSQINFLHECAAEVALTILSVICHKWSKIHCFNSSQKRTSRMPRGWGTPIAPQWDARLRAALSATEARLVQDTGH